MRDLQRPPYPAHWDRIVLGQPEEKARWNVRELNPSLRKIKGVDVVGFDLGNRYWVLHVGYDAKHEVGLIEKIYVDRKASFMNKSIISSLRNK